MAGWRGGAHSLTATEQLLRVQESRGVRVPSVADLLSAPAPAVVGGNASHGGEACAMSPRPVFSVFAISERRVETVIERITVDVYAPYPSHGKFRVIPGPGAVAVRSASQSVIRDKCNRTKQRENTELAEHESVSIPILLLLRVYRS